MNVDILLNDLLSQIQIKKSDDKNMDITNVALDIVKVLGLCKVDNTAYWYTGTHYQIVDEPTINSAIARFLMNESKAFITEVWFKTSHFIMEKTFDRDRKFLSVKNGLIDLDDVVKYGKVVLQKHTKEYFCLYYLDFEYKKYEDLSYGDGVKLADFIASFTYDSFSEKTQKPVDSRLEEFLEKAEKGQVQELSLIHI